MTTSDPTPDAVAMLKRMHARAAHSENHGDVPRIGSDELLVILRAAQAERARHAEEVARLEAEHLSDLETIEAWKLASGLECGGDPDGVTPAGMRRYWEGVEADRDSLRDQLRKVEGLIGSDAVRRINDLEIQLCTVKGQLEEANEELASLRSLLPDVRACAEYIVERGVDNADGSARRILAASETQP